MDVPERFQPLMQELLQQLIDFEKAYGYVPKCQLVSSDEYKDLVARYKRLTS